MSKLQKRFWFNIEPYFDMGDEIIEYYIYKILTPVRINPFPKPEFPRWWTQEDMDWDEDDKLIF